MQPPVVSLVKQRFTSSVNSIQKIMLKFTDYLNTNKNINLLETTDSLVRSKVLRTARVLDIVESVLTVQQTEPFVPQISTKMFSKVIKMFSTMS